MVVHHFLQMYYRFKARVLSCNYSLLLLSAEKASQHSAQINAAGGRFALLVIPAAEKATAHLNERAEIEAAAGTVGSALSVQLADHCAQHPW